MSIYKTKAAMATNPAMALPKSATLLEEADPSDGGGMFGAVMFGGSAPSVVVPLCCPTKTGFGLEVGCSHPPGQTVSVTIW